MTDSGRIVSSLLNVARPRLISGWNAQSTGAGELTVCLRSRGRYAVLAADAMPLLPLLEGELTLNEVAAHLAEKSAAARHQTILDSVARLHVAGLLEPLDEDVGRFLESQFKRGKARTFLRFLSFLAAFRLLIPLRFGGKGAARPLASVSPYAGLAGFILFFLAWLQQFSGGPQSIHGRASFFGADPVVSMLHLVVGAAVALSILELCRAVLLLIAGRTVQGAGLKITVGIPHFGVDSRDEAMFTRDERKSYRSLMLALSWAVPACLMGTARAFSLGGLYFAGIGASLTLQVLWSPLWPSDLSNYIEEVAGYRSLRRRSGLYLFRKLWRNLLGRGAPGKEEAALLVHATLSIFYLFVLVAVFARLAPETVDGLTSAFMSPDTTAWRLVLAVAIAIYLWAGLLVAALAITAALIAGLVQLAMPAARATRPVEVVSASDLSLDELAHEVSAIPPFAGLPPDLVRQTLSAGRVEKHGRGAVIIQQGDAGHTCYVVRSGECDVVVEDASGEKTQVGLLRAGALFGEVALLEESPRMASVKARGEVEVVAMDRATFLALVESGGWDRADVMDRVRMHAFLKKLDLFRGLSPENMATVIGSLSVVRADKDQVLVREGEEGDTMFIIFTGRVEVLKEGMGRVAELGEGNYFGEIAVVTGRARTATCRCLEPSVLASLPARVYQDALVGQFSLGLMLDREIEARLESLSLL